MYRSVGNNFSSWDKIGSFKFGLFEFHISNSKVKFGRIRIISQILKNRKFKSHFDVLKIFSKPIVTLRLKFVNIYVGF